MVCKSGTIQRELDRILSREIMPDCLKAKLLSRTNAKAKMPLTQNHTMDSDKYSTDTLNIQIFLNPF